MRNQMIGFLMEPKNRYMSALILLTTIGFNVMRGVRETIVFQFGQNGAMYTPFIRVLCILPFSALLFIYYLSVKRRSNSMIAYYAMTIPLLCYFIGYQLFANQSVIDPSQLPNWIMTAKSFYAPLEFVSIIAYHWDKTLYYVCCEAWGSFTLVILFWQIANEIYSRQEAARNYPMFSMLGGVGITLASMVIDQMGRQQNVIFITTQIITMIGITNLWLVSQVWRCQKDKHLVEQKKSVSLHEGFKIALTTPHILYLAICIISFSILITVCENAVRDMILHQYSNENMVFKFWGSFFFGKGLMVISANFISRSLLKQFGWFYVAIITPIICIFTIHFVLGIPLMQKAGIITGQSQAVLWILTILLQLSFAIKYAFFDPTKEMAYIPLPANERTYGKTVADGLGSRIGNVSSGLIQTIAIMIASGSEFSEIAPALFVMCSLISLSWTWAMGGLSGSYHSLIKQEEQSTTFDKPVDIGAKV